MVELWKIDGDTGNEKRCTWRYANHCRRLNRMFSIPTKKMALGHYQWRYTSAHFGEVRCVSDTFEIYKEVIVLTEEEIIFANAVKLQNIIRMRLARRRVKSYAEQMDQAEALRTKSLDKLRHQYKKLARANAKRNQMLLSKRDKMKEQSMKDRLDEADAEIEAKRARLEKVKELERARILELQDEAREERERVASDTINNAEMQRRMLARKQQNFTEPLQMRDQFSISAEMPIFGTRLKEEQCQYDDTLFSASDYSLHGNNAPAWFTEMGSVTWKRPAEISGRGKHAPFLEKISVSSVVSSSVVAAHAPHLHFCLSVLASYPVLLERILNIEYAEHGMYGVCLYSHGEWQVVIVDDRIPCTVSEGGIIQPRFCRGVLSTDPRGSGVTEVWPMIIERALAKHLGSYALLMTPRADVVNILSYLLGGFSNVAILKPLVMDDSDDNASDTSSDNSSNSESSASSIETEEGDKAFESIHNDAWTSDQSNFDLVRWLRAFSHKSQSTIRRRNAISDLDGGGSAPPLMLMAVSMTSPDGKECEREASPVEVTYNESCTSFDPHKWNARIMDVVTVNVATIISDMEEEAIEAAQIETSEIPEPDIVEKPTQKLKPILKGNLMSRIKPKKAQVAQSGRDSRGSTRLKRNDSSQASRSKGGRLQARKISSTISEDSVPTISTPLHDLPPEITLIKLKSYNGKQWKGKWGADSVYWTEEFVTASGYDDIGDGSFWVSLRELCLHFTEWGVLYRPLLTREDAKQIAWYHRANTDLFWAAEQSAAGIEEDIASRNPAVVIRARDINFVLIEAEYRDTMATHGEVCPCEILASSTSQFSNEGLVTVSLKTSRKKTFVLDINSFGALSQGE